MELQYGPYSPSRLDTASCGYSFIRQYGPDRAARVKQAPSIASERGSAVHEIFEEITTKLKTEPGCVFSAGEVRDLVTKAIHRHPAAINETAEIMDMTRKYIDRPPPVLTTDAEVERRFAVLFSHMQEGWEHGETGERFTTFVELPKIERRAFDGTTFVVDALTSATWPVFTECDYDDPKAFARGRADILVISDDTTQAIVYDHKTQPNIEDADTFQMGMYAWMVKQIYPFLSEVRTVLHFARYGRYSPPFVWSRWDLNRIEDDLMTRVSIVESRTSWEATPHKSCQYCPFLSTCPALADYIDVQEDGAWKVKPQSLKILGSTAKAVDTAGAINVLEELVKRMKEELKEHVKAAGVGIAIPGKKYDFWPSDPKVDWETVNKSLRKETYGIFEKYGVDPKSFMGFSQTFSAPVWKLSEKTLLDDLSALFPKTVETEFRGKKI